ncbi:MAG: DNA-binding response OmpR family regulator [Hyphomicrobiaceae bacterium]|jgi:DNA-binding response OmpR family regulator
MIDAAAPARILIADDDPVFREVAASCLRNSGYDVDLASEGAEAMDVLLREAFDLAIVDLIMPRIDGLRLIALVRATPILRALPILVITSEEDPTIHAEGLQVGANDYLTKPVDWSELPGRVAALLDA